jgi:hypothetical protein
LKSHTQDIVVHIIKKKKKSFPGERKTKWNIFIHFSNLSGTEKD